MLAQLLAPGPLCVHLLPHSHADSAVQLDMRAEVGLLSSSLVITSPDAAAQAATGGEKFGGCPFLPGF